MIKKTVSGMVVLFALICSSQSADPALEMDDAAFEAWLTQQAAQYAEEDILQRIIQDSLELSEQSSQKSATTLENYIRSSSDKLNSAGVYCTTKNNENEIAFMDDEIASELKSYDIDHLNTILKNDNFKNLNKIIQGIVERVAFNKNSKAIDEKEALFIPNVLSFDGKVSPHFSNETFIPINKTLKLSENLFYTLGEDPYFKYAYGPKIVERQNSSGANNCCLLFSIIGNNAKLYAKIMGVTEQAAQAYFDTNPELSNESPEDCGVNGVNRREFKQVRAKFFDDIMDNLDTDHYTQEGQISIRAFLERNLWQSDLTRAKFVETDSNRKTLDWIHENDLNLDSFFSTIFGWLYDVKVVVLNGVDGNPLLENANLNQFNLMPKIEASDVPHLIYVYIGGFGGHYQKLKVL